MTEAVASQLMLVASTCKAMLIFFATHRDIFHSVDVIGFVQQNYIIKYTGYDFASGRDRR